MGLGPTKVSAFQRTADVTYSARLHHRRIRVALQYGDTEDALQTLDELEALYEQGAVSDSELYEQDRNLVAIKRLVNAMFTSPDGPAGPGGKAKTA